MCLPFLKNTIATHDPCSGLLPVMREAQKYTPFLGRWMAEFKANVFSLSRAFALGYPLSMTETKQSPGAVVEKVFSAPGADELGTLPVSDVFSMSGMDFLTGILEGRHPNPPIAGPMRMRLIELAPGKAVFASDPDEHLLNPIGTVHGGYAMTLLDSCMGCAVHSTLQSGEAYITVEAKVNMVRPILPHTGVVRATGTLIHRGRTTATAEGKLTSDNGKLLAHGTTTCSIMPAPKG